MSQTLKSDKICKCVKISDKNIFMKLKNLKRLVAKTIEVIKNRPKQIILCGWNRIVCLELVSVL